MTQVEILVLDFGSQYTQLIARRLRECGIYTEIAPYFEKIENIKAKNPKGLILSGGPASVYEKDAFKPDSKIFSLHIPVLGICYGMQYIADFFDGKVVRASAQEFGKARLEILESRHIYSGIRSHAVHFGDFCIALAKKEDLEEILALQHRVFVPEAERIGFLDIDPLTQDLQSIKQEFQTYTILKCSTNGKIVGSVRGYKQANRAYIRKLFVDSAFVGNGIAKNLIMALESALDAKQYEIYTSAESVANIARYEQLGYREFKRENIGGGKGAQAVFLEKILGDKAYINPLFFGVKRESIVWMSHADKVEQIPSGFIELAKSGNTHYCAIADRSRRIYALQFHPEVVHSECGGVILENFALRICGCIASWNMHNFIESEIAKIRKIVFGTNASPTKHEAKMRCSWACDEGIYQAYHDNEWGVPLHDEHKLFEFLILESMQAGLSWITILKKREALREAFDGFDPNKVALYDSAKIDLLLQNKGIIRNRAKIESAINNARRFLEIAREFGSFDAFIWSYVKNKPIINTLMNVADIPTQSALSRRISKDLQKRGFRFLGPTTIYAFMQAIGMVNDHLEHCICKKDSNARTPLPRAINTSKDCQDNKDGESKVLCAVSGGVDSSVVATLLYRAIGERLIPVFVDTGLLRLGEREAVEKMFRESLGVPLISIDASEIFLGRLKGVVEPEKKRKIIGETFIEVFEKEAKRHNANGAIKFLAQGTLYPDVIESVSIKGPSKTIKSHHNVGGLPEWMQFKLIEPLRELFKDEVRSLGRELGMSETMLMRHPFPGPGLAIRIMGEVNRIDLEILKRADAIFIEELRDKGLYDSVWQAFCVLLNVRSVGVMGDNRTYDNTICLRAVEAIDGMTATFAHLKHDFLEHVANRIINEVEGINRVVYDITSKPPGTIEWE